MTQDLALMPASALTKLFAEGKSSPVEATKAVLARIERWNGVINAFCWLDPDAALAAARESEARWNKRAPLSALDGITTTVKDLSITRGWPTLRGSRAISARGPWSEDSPSVARMREAGAVILGKTTVPEMGAWHITKTDLHGITRNPWNPQKTPGGSSGGAAASVAAGMGTIALASDASGSIRVPASFSGMLGLKTTFGVVPDYPTSYLGSTAVIGPITRTVEDAALCMSIICGDDWRDSYAIPSDAKSYLEGLDRGVAGLRIAYSPTLGFAKVDPEVAALVENGVRLLEKLGAKVTRVERIFDDITDALEAIRVTGMANAFRQLGFKPEDYPQMLAHLPLRAAAGLRVTAIDYMIALEKREALGARMRQFHQDYDILLTPTLSVPAMEADDPVHKDPRYAEIKPITPFGAHFNMTRQPAASVPVGMTATGLPVGMQVVGPLFADALVLRVCRAIEREQPFPLPDLDVTLASFPSQSPPAGLAGMERAKADMAPLA